MAPPSNAFDEFKALVSSFKKLKASLPKSIPLATKTSRIVQVFKSKPVPDNPIHHWETFDGRFNALYGEDLRDKVTGRLPNIERGKNGLDLVSAYVQEMLEASSITWDLAIPKLKRLVDELEALQGTATEKSGTAKPKAKGKAKASKGADGSESLSEDDGDYAPPRKSRGDSDDDDDFPDGYLDEDGEEASVETELGKELREKRAAAKASQATGSQARTEPTARKRTVVDMVDEVNSGDESDGGSALRNVEARKKAGTARGPKSTSIEEFKDAVADTGTSKSDLRWTFKCKHCGGVRTFKRTVKGDNAQWKDEHPKPKLSNLASHLRECDKYQAAKKTAAADKPDDAGSNAPKYNLPAVSSIMADFLREGELNPAVVTTQKGFLKIFALWILDEDLPWTTGQSPMLRDLFKYLGVTQQLPSDTTVRNELARVFADLHGKVVREFSNVKSKISYSTDTWTTRQMTYTFACTIASFIDEDWNLVERIIDFKALEEKEHQGWYAAKAFVQGARGVGSLHKICLSQSFLSCKLTSSHDYFMALVMDNASSNDELFRNVAQYLLSLYKLDHHPDRQIRCLNHIINLVAQAVLAGLDEADPCDDIGDQHNDDADYYLSSKENPTHFDITQDTAQQELEAERTKELNMEFVDIDEFDLLGCAGFDEVAGELNEMGLTSALKKLRFIVTKIASSPQRRQRFWKISEAEYGERRVNEEDPDSALLRLLMVVRDVRTRWNSTHAMIERALLLREAIDEWVLKTKKYRGVCLSLDEWNELEVLGSILAPFTEVTKQLSSSEYPTVPFSLPIYFKMHAHLSSASRDPKISMKIRTAVGLGLSKLNKYKEKAEKNHYLKIATALHPSMRAEWFRKTAPPLDIRAQQKAVDDIKTVIRNVAKGYQREMAEEKQSSGSLSTESTAPPPLQRSQSSSSFFSDFCDVPDVEPLEIAELTPEEELDDELRRYFAFEGGKGQLFDPLAWWKSHCSRFPILARMARDFLAIPATSVSVERTFSKSRRICTELRSALKSSTVTQALLTKVWIRSKHFQLVDPPERPRKRQKTTP